MHLETRSLKLEHLSKALKVKLQKAGWGITPEFGSKVGYVNTFVFASLRFTHHFKQVVIFTMALCRGENNNLSTCRPNNDSLEISSTLPVSLETTSSANLAEDTVPVEAAKLSTYTTCALFGVIGNLLVIKILRKLRGKKTCMTFFFDKLGDSGSRLFAAGISNGRYSGEGSLWLAFWQVCLSLSPTFHRDISRCFRLVYSNCCCRAISENSGQKSKITRCEEAGFLKESWNGCGLYMGGVVCDVFSSTVFYCWFPKPARRRNNLWPSVACLG